MLATSFLMKIYLSIYQKKPQKHISIEMTLRTTSCVLYCDRAYWNLWHLAFNPDHIEHAIITTCRLIVTWYFYGLGLILNLSGEACMNGIKSNCNDFRPTSFLFDKLERTLSPHKYTSGWMLIHLKAHVNTLSVKRCKSILSF